MKKGKKEKGYLAISIPFYQYSSDARLECVRYIHHVGTRVEFGFFFRV